MSKKFQDDKIITIYNLSYNIRTSEMEKFAFDLKSLTSAYLLEYATKICDPQVVFCLAGIYSLQNRPDDALKFLKEGISLDNFYFDPQHFLWDNIRHMDQFSILCKMYD